MLIFHHNNSGAGFVQIVLWFHFVNNRSSSNVLDTTLITFQWTKQFHIMVMVDQTKGVKHYESHTSCPWTSIYNLNHANIFEHISWCWCCFWSIGEKKRKKFYVLSRCSTTVALNNTVTEKRGSSSTFKVKVSILFLSFFHSINNYV